MELKFKTPQQLLELDPQTPECGLLYLHFQVDCLVSYLDSPFVYQIIPNICFPQVRPPGGGEVPGGAGRQRLHQEHRGLPARARGRAVWPL